MKVLVAQSRPTLGDPMHSSQPGSSVHGIFQARILSELPFPFPKTCNKLLSRYYYLHVICEETEASQRLSNLPKVTQQFRIQIQATQLQNPVALLCLDFCFIMTDI